MRDRGALGGTMERWTRAWVCGALALGAAAAGAQAPGALAKDVAYIGGVEIIREDGPPPSAARGRVFLDANRNARLDPGEEGIAGVLVSNGLDVVRTDADGAYALPAYADMNLFISKPAGYATPVDAAMVPQFSYIHKEAGSPPLRFGGVAPTGPLPHAVNFPLVADGSDAARFTCLIFGDAQPYSNREVSYVRDTLGAMLSARDMDDVECLIFEGDVMGDDLSLFPRFQSIVALGRTPQYYVAGNHDVDFDAEHDAHSLDTFRREWGPEYYSFDIGQAHFVVLDNVRYPCNGVDDHPFCALDARTTYNGVISARQLAWLRNDLAATPRDRLIVLNAHIPLASFTDADSAKSQVDNLPALYAIIGDRPALGLFGHAHTTEQIEPGEGYEGWTHHTGVATAPFHQIITGAVSGAWWAGDLNDQGAPHGTQRLGAPRGYYEIAFDGASYVDSYRAFGEDPQAQMHVGFNTPRFRAWAEAVIAYATHYDPPSEIPPPVTVNDLGDPNMISRADLAGGAWAAVNVWNGSGRARVSVSIDGGAAFEARRTQTGAGEAALDGPAYADPRAFIRQATNARQAIRSAQGGEATAGFETWRGRPWRGAPGPFPRWMLATKSSHLWRVTLPPDLAAGAHVLEVRATDRYGRTFTHRQPFEVVEELPEMGWRGFD